MQVWLIVLLVVIGLIAGGVWAWFRSRKAKQASQ
jgi:uncharacterized protein YneF (UPF0154 family)